MKYFKNFKDGSGAIKISKDEALHIILGSYKDCDMVRDWLTVVNRIPCMFSIIWSESDDGLVLMSGLAYVTPDGVEYDDSGKRV